jgi:hypothetical protein
MPERLEYSGNPLPSGLPGFGGGTIDVLTLPGFNRVVAAQKFGPVNDAPNATPPNPKPPAGSNPEDPTDEVVNPTNPPTQPGIPTPIFCKECADQGDFGDAPLMYGVKNSDSCVDCSGKPKTVSRYFSELAASSPSSGIFYSDTASIKGKLGGKEWTISPTELILDGSQGGVALNETHLVLGYTNARQTYYQFGPEIIDPDGNHYTPQELQVCEGGQTKTWKVLAYKPE